MVTPSLHAAAIVQEAKHATTQRGLVLLVVRFGLEISREPRTGPVQAGHDFVLARCHR
jgi:hypothetical protein